MASLESSLTRRGNPLISRADLLRVLVTGGSGAGPIFYAKENAALAELLGFELKPDEPKAARLAVMDFALSLPLLSADVSDVSDVSDVANVSNAPDALDVSDVHDVSNVSDASDLARGQDAIEVGTRFKQADAPKESVAPESVQPGNDEDVFSRSQNVPPRQPLRPWNAVRCLLDNALGTTRLRQQPDVARAVVQLAQGGPLRRLPRLTRKGIGGEVWLLIDYAPHLRPFWDDANDLWPRLAHLLGRENFRLRWIENGPLGEWQGEDIDSSHSVLPPHAQVLVLSDLGSMAQNAVAAHEEWRQWGAWLAGRGICVHVFSPVWPVLSMAGLQAYAWEGRRGRVAVAGVVEALLASLAMVWMGDFALLRALRRCIPGSAAADEVRCLQAANLEPDDGCLQIAAAQLPQLREQFVQLPSAVQAGLLAVLRTWRKTKSPTVQVFEQLVAAEAGFEAAPSSALWQQLMTQMAANKAGVAGAETVWLGAIAAAAPFCTQPERALPMWQAIHGACEKQGLPLPIQGGRVPWDVFEKPAWASMIGTDEIGKWAEMNVNNVVQRLRWIEPGHFLMGSPETETGRLANEGPQHWVTVSRGFWLADTACTQELWQAVMGENPSYFHKHNRGGPQHPVENVSWDMVQWFLQMMRAKFPGCQASLPTEAEWEYACRAGSKTAFSSGETISTAQSNFNGNYPYGNRKRGEYRTCTVPVKKLLANKWGLYQMHGNVWEWCADVLREYAVRAVSDPGLADALIVPGKGDTARALRGGGWGSEARGARSACRGHGRPGGQGGNTGFRWAFRS